MFNERPSTQLTSSKAWHEYANVLYDKRQPTTQLVSPHVLYPWAATLPHPCESNFFTPEKVRNVIDKLQVGKAQDNDGLVG